MKIYLLMMGFAFFGIWSLLGTIGILINDPMYFVSPFAIFVYHVPLAVTIYLWRKMGDPHKSK